MKKILLTDFDIHCENIRYDFVKIKKGILGDFVSRSANQDNSPNRMRNLIFSENFNINIQHNIEIGFMTLG